MVMDNLSTKKINTKATNVTSTASINWHSKTVRECYILLTVLLAIILILIIIIIIIIINIIIIFYLYAKRKGHYFYNINTLEDFEMLAKFA